MTIELVPHVGRGKRGPIELDQFQVMQVIEQNGEVKHFRLGYVAKAPGAPLILIARLSEREKAEVKAEVERLKADGVAIGRVAETPSLVDPPAESDD